MAHAKLILIFSLIFALTSTHHSPKERLEHLLKRAEEKMEEVFTSHHGTKKPDMNPFDEYINKEDPNYNWFETGVTFKTRTGGTAHMLNVTS